MPPEMHVEGSPTYAFGDESVGAREGLLHGAGLDWIPRMTRGALLMGRRLKISMRSAWAIGTGTPVGVCDATGRIWAL